MRRGGPVKAAGSKNPTVRRPTLTTGASRILRPMHRSRRAFLHALAALPFGLAPIAAFERPGFA